MTAPPRNVAVVGSGYVGTTIAACLADVGHEVTAIDIDESIVEQINAGEAPIHEPGLQELIASTAGDTLTATTEHDAIRDADVTFLTVQTPAREDGSLDASALTAATKDVGEALADVEDYQLVVVKSTVFPDVLESAVVEPLESRAGPIGESVGVAVNPEFLREGTAVNDFIDPDRIVIGADSDTRAIEELRAVYDRLYDLDSVPVLETNRKEASLIKYASNTFLAAKVSLINDIGNICKEYGVDAYTVAEGIGLDDRIEAQFLRSGVGWGGSCFPKDTAALVAGAKAASYEPPMIEATIEVNERQPARMLALLDHHVDVTDQPVAVLGLAFKPGTDDTRHSRAIPIIEELLDRGATGRGYDPRPGARTAMEERFDSLEVVDSAQAAMTDAVGACVVTDWPEFSELDEEFDAMAEPVVIDGRRIIDPPETVIYEGLTW